MATLTVLIVWVSRLVLISLVGLSIWSVSIILDRKKLLTKIDQLESFNDVLEATKSAKSISELQSQIRQREGVRFSTLRSTVDAIEAMKSHSIEEQQLAADRAVRSYLSLQKTELEKGLTILATLGSNAPFIGLFGTVLGIIQAFTALSDNQSAAGSVMVGISEALVATAIGLFVAIPAVVAYNYFTRKIKVIISECEAIRDQVLSRTWKA